MSKPDKNSNKAVAPEKPDSASNSPSFLDRLYPEKTVEFHGMKVVVKPLTIRQIASVTDKFINIFNLKKAGKTDMEIMLSARDDMVDVLSLVVDKPFDDMPGPLLPLILRVFFAQNLSADVLGNWTSLGAEVAKTFGIDVGKLLGQADNQEAAH